MADEAYKRFMVGKTDVTLFDVYAASEEDAINMVKGKRHRTVGSPTQEGYTEILPTKAAWTAYPAPKESDGNK